MNELVDVRGNPLRKDLLKREIAAPTLASVRSPMSGYPADGLNPGRVASILREADQSNPLRYFELAEQIEERDLHYAAVLGTRKRSVSQVDVTVEAASESQHDVELADMIREWLRRDELADETFDILDAVGKGVSFTEIMWDTSEGQWQPARLEWCDPRFFTFDRNDGRKALLRGGVDGNGQDEPLPPFKFIQARIKAKSGLPARSGIARLATWNWMFKAFTQRDWAIFAQTFGQPVRVGKFHSGASEADKQTLFRAVANIAGDCAAIIPQEMVLEFIESANVGAGSDLYEKRAVWLDLQTSKAVLGQTTTTDAVSGGHAVSQEHRQVQEDIETADCKALAAVLNRDLIRPWVDLERGPQRRYPRLVIARPKPEDVVGLTEALAKLVPLGFKVSQSEIRDKLGLTEPGEGEELLSRPIEVKTTPPGQLQAPATSLQAEQPAAPAGPAEAIGDRIAGDVEPEMAEMLGTIEAMMARASDLGELREMLVTGYPKLDQRKLAEKVAAGLVAAELAGRSDLVAESA